MPPAQSDLAREVLKDPYTFDFLSLSEAAHERELGKTRRTKAAGKAKP